jgi:hypothetical protein
MQDALGNEIIIGKHYAFYEGDTIFQRVFVGRVLSICEIPVGVGDNKVIMTNVHIRCCSCGRPDGDFKKENRVDRIVYACSLFPILTLAEYRNIQIDSILAED